ncbi:hypothetical protein B0T09DRAFT_349123 [Sordaria sp. MPI-SDFR-AT-0083]|nr:hypothetical protein B0T09DRAFT_349123 [Sordaria sp. MPI-SDFR-AT-0083]
MTLFLQFFGVFASNLPSISLKISIKTINNSNSAFATCPSTRHWTVSKAFSCKKCPCRDSIRYLFFCASEFSPLFASFN